MEAEILTTIPEPTPVPVPQAESEPDVTPGATTADQHGDILGI